MDLHEVKASLNLNQEPEKPMALCQKKLAVLKLQMNLEWYIIILYLFTKKMSSRIQVG